jgi:hypothetical protein
MLSLFVVAGLETKESKVRCGISLLLDQAETHWHKHFEMNVLGDLCS